MRDFREYQVWQKSHDLTIEVYRATSDFPGEERFGLTSQIRRSAASIGANIAEGCVRASDADFARFVSISLGSASELQNHLVLARDLGMLASESCERLFDAAAEVKRMLTGLHRTLRAES